MGDDEWAAFTLSVEIPVVARVAEDARRALRATVCREMIGRPHAGVLWAYMDSAFGMRFGTACADEAAARASAAAIQEMLAALPEYRAHERDVQITTTLVNMKDIRSYVLRE
jgi:hypothetical protein